MLEGLVTAIFPNSRPFSISLILTRRGRSVATTNYSLFDLYSLHVGVGSSDSVPVDAAEAWPAGTAVLTIFGAGRILSFRALDSVYEVQLPFGKGYLKASVIIGAEELSPHALATIGIIKDATTGVDKLYGSTFAEVAASLSTNGGASSGLYG